MESAIDQSGALGSVATTEARLARWLATVDRLVDCWRWVDRPAIRPHAFVPGLAETNESLAFGARFSGPPRKNRCHRAGPAQLLGKRFPIAAAKGRRLMLRCHRSIHFLQRWRLLERRPAAVFLVMPGPLGAGVV
jgi:hypothetical protein